MRITCLHTAASNIAVFDNAAKELGLGPDVLLHAVRADLLVAAEDAGGLTADIASATRLELVSLARRSDVVVLTCSTLGPSVEAITSHRQAPILRADEALARAAALAGGNIVVLCAVQTTLEPTSRLFSRAAEQSGVRVQVRLVAGAWAQFKSGDMDAYLATIARAADLAYGEGAVVIALAQASMAGAAAQVTAGPVPLTSAITGLQAALKAAASRT